MNRLNVIRLRHAIATSVFMLLYIYGQYGIEKSELATLWWSDMFWTAASLIAGIRCFQTAGKEKAHIRAAWNYFGFACIAWFLGMLAWNYLELVQRRTVPFPGVPDIGFMLFAPMLMIGIIRYRATAESVSLTLKRLSELGLILATILITLIIILYDPIRTLEESFLYVATAVAYPVLYMGVFFFGLSTPFVHPSRDKRHVMTLVLIGIAIHAFTDTIYAYMLLGKTYAVGDYLDVFWLLGFAAFYWAALEQSLAPRHQTETTQVRFFELVGQRIEDILPAALLTWLVLLFMFFLDEISDQVLVFVAPVGFMMAVFYALLGWSQGRLQEQLYQELSASKRSLQEAYDELDKRVVERTEELRVARDQALESSQAKSDFLSKMSHELRTPMNAILGFSQLLELELVGASREKKKYIEEIIAAGNHLLALINDLLDLQSIESGRQGLDMMPTSVSSVLTESIKMTAAMASTRNIQVVDELCGQDVRVMADKTRLNQVFTNLLSNGIKYNVEGGSLRISCEEHGNKTVVVRFQDTGVGIRKEDQAKVFEPFFRVGNGAVEGTGIGLPVTRELVHAMNGNIDLISEPGKGSTFSVYLNKAG